MKNLPTQFYLLKHTYSIGASFLVFIVILTFSISCSKEKLPNHDWQSQLDIINEEKLINFNDRTALEVGAAIGSFYDELTNDGYQEFLKRVKTFKNIPQEEMSVFTLKKIAKIFKINEKSIIEYIRVLQVHEKYIINPDNKSNIAIGLYKYAETQANKVTRRFFSRIAKWAGAKDCGFWMHAANIADTTASIAAGAASVDLAIASGGGATPLAAIAVGNAVDSYAATVEYVTDCMK